MTNKIDLIDNEFYWVKFKGHIYLSNYYNNDFHFMGTDEDQFPWNVEVLDKATVIIPDWIDKEKLMFC